MLVACEVPFLEEFSELEDVAVFCDCDEVFVDKVSVDEELASVC